MPKLLGKYHFLRCQVQPTHSCISRWNQSLHKIHLIFISFMCFKTTVCKKNHLNFISFIPFFNPKFSKNHAISTTRIVQGWKDIKNKSSKLNSSTKSTHSTFSHSMNFPKVWFWKNYHSSNNWPYQLANKWEINQWRIYFCIKFCPKYNLTILLVSDVPILGLRPRTARTEGFLGGPRPYKDRSSKTEKPAVFFGP